MYKAHSTAPGTGVQGHTVTVGEADEHSAPQASPTRLRTAACVLPGNKQLLDGATAIRFGFYNPLDFSAEFG